MPQTVKGVIAMEQDAPVTIENIIIPDPGPGEAVVAIQACGVCHTDLHYREGGINDEFPFLLGHEASGIVEAVGEGKATPALELSSGGSGAPAAGGAARPSRRKPCRCNGLANSATRRSRGRLAARSTRPDG